MAERRDFMRYIGTGAIGSIVGYYIGAQELLGIQSEEVVRRSTENTPTGDTPADDTPAEDNSGDGSGLVSTGFPRYQYDNKNTGNPPNTVGPGGSPSVRW
jgi:hypothetical protein